ncbi:hypothetical protein HYT56_00310 [Candidatus Woesearchaeota archaeon]|nr:hypothetical protein [Candidatus Woesearchaeota archaeon]
MGGCYGSSYGWMSPCTTSKRTIIAQKKKKVSKPNWQQHLKKFSDEHELDDLVEAYKGFFRTRKNGGFFAELAKSSGIDDVAKIPKEFSNYEYEVKFDVQPTGSGEEPKVADYLNAFDFPAAANARFLKDPVNTVAMGINHFLGDGLDERLVIIEKGGGTFLKEKGRVIPLDFGIPYEEIVMKREEARYAANIQQILEKAAEVKQEDGVDYRGKIRKEKGDAFVLDTNDGRIYSMSFTRSHLIKADETAESEIQRQLEFEYAGFLPKFPGFEEKSERQIIQGLVDVAKYTYVLYNGAKIKNNWKINLGITGERKYDFICGNKVELPGRRELPSINLIPGRVKEVVN